MSFLCYRSAVLRIPVCTQQIKLILKILLSGEMHFKRIHCAAAGALNRYNSFVTYICSGELLTIRHVIGKKEPVTLATVWGFCCFFFLFGHVKLVIKIKCIDIFPHMGKNLHEKACQISGRLGKYLPRIDKLLH